MASVKLVSYSEINANTMSGVMFDTAVYGTASPAIVRVGRDVKDGGCYINAGTQTGVTAKIILDTFNAFHGAEILIKQGTQGLGGTTLLQVVSGSAAGVTVGQLTSGVQDEIICTYDGFAGVWR